MVGVKRPSSGTRPAIFQASPRPTSFWKRMRTCAQPRWLLAGASRSTGPVRHAPVFSTPPPLRSHHGPRGRLLLLQRDERLGLGLDLLVQALRVHPGRERLRGMQCESASRTGPRRHPAHSRRPELACPLCHTLLLPLPCPLLRRARPRRLSPQLAPQPGAHLGHRVSLDVSNQRAGHTRLDHARRRCRGRENRHRCPPRISPRWRPQGAAQPSCRMAPATAAASSLRAPLWPEAVAARLGVVECSDAHPRGGPSPCCSRRRPSSWSCASSCLKSRAAELLRVGELGVCSAASSAVMKFAAPKACGCGGRGQGRLARAGRGAGISLAPAWGLRACRSRRPACDACRGTRHHGEEQE